MSFQSHRFPKLLLSKKVRSWIPISSRKHFANQTSKISVLGALRMEWGWGLDIWSLGKRGVGLSNKGSSGRIVLCNVPFAIHMVFQSASSVSCYTILKLASMPGLKLGGSMWKQDRLAGDRLRFTSYSTTQELCDLGQVPCLCDS